MNQQILKLYSFKLAQGIDRNDFLQASLYIQHFLRNQDGCEYRSLSYSEEDDVWVDTYYYRDATAAAAIDVAFMADDKCKHLMAMIDPDTVSIRRTTIEQSSCMSEAA